MKKPKSNYTIETFLEELEQSGRRLRKSNKGHRALLSSSLQTAQRVIVKFLDNKTLHSQFVRAVQKGNKKGRKKSAPFNWCLEVVAKATGASSPKGRKLASKRAGVLEYLRNREVPVKDTAATVKKEGLEKLYSEWCNKKKKNRVAEASNGRQQLSPTVAKNKTNHNDREVILPLRMKLSDRDQLLDQKFGSMLTVLVRRVSENDGNFQVKRVIGVDRLGEEADDWQE
jgi:hypothetical protein